MNSRISGYGIFLVVILAFLQFTTILDFMVLSPLSAMLIPELKLSPQQFGFVVSGYAWSAGISGILAAGFADKYDRKKMLLIFYTGFILGTFLCGVAPGYISLLAARIVTGIFGGVLGSITYAIVTDVFALEVRGRVMGFPIGLHLANRFGWHSPFLMIVGVCIIVLIFIVIYMKPVDGHLKAGARHNPVQHFIRTVSNRTYAKAFGSTILLATGGFMLMPFGSAFAVNNLGIKLSDLPLLYTVTGMVAMVTAPLIGKLSDAWGKYLVFCICSTLLIFVLLIYCNLGFTPLWLVITFSTLMFINFSGRMVASTALLTAVPEPADRGAFMSVNSSINMISGGIASLIAGAIVKQSTPVSPLENYDVVAYIVSGATIITMGLMYVIHQIVRTKQRLAT
jgi:predicted MFS family arabinose efflux permease